MEENEKNKGENYGEGKRKNIFFLEVRRGKKFYLMVLSIAVPIMIQNGITNFVSLLDNIMTGGSVQSRCPVRRSSIS